LRNCVAGNPDLHAAVKPLEWLLGCWKTTDGFGHYPTIKNFHYVEQLEFFHTGQPNLQFMQVNLLHDQSVKLRNIFLLQNSGSIT